MTKVEQGRKHKWKRVRLKREAGENCWRQKPKRREKRGSQKKKKERKRGQEQIMYKGMKTVTKE